MIHNFEMARSFYGDASNALKHEETARRKAIDQSINGGKSIHFAHKLGLTSISSGTISLTRTPDPTNPRFSTSCMPPNSYPSGSWLHRRRNQPRAPAPMRSIFGGNLALPASVASRRPDRRAGRLGCDVDRPDGAGALDGARKGSGRSGRASQQRHCCNEESRRVHDCVLV